MSTVLKIKSGVDEVAFDGDVARVIGSHVHQGRQEDRVTEVLDLVIRGATTSEVRQNVHNLNDLLMLAREWVKDELRSASVYVVWQTTGETEKRALLFDFELLPVEDRVFGVLDIDKLKTTWRLALTRAHAWEATGAVQDSSATAIDALGGKFDPSGTLSGGDFNARLQALQLTTEGTAGNQAQVWIGVRPLRGGVSSFDPVIECEDSLTTLQADTSSVADGDASGGNAVQCDFSATTEMVFRFYNTVPTEAAGVPFLQGRYHILMRAKVDTGTAAARLGVSLTAPSLATPHARGQIVYVTDTAYTLYDMGTFALPYSILRGQISGAFSDVLLSILAEEVDGTPTLSCDAFVLVPAEHSVYMEDVEQLGGGNRLDLRTTEDNEVVAIVETSLNEALSLPAVSDTGTFTWSYPREGGIVVVASQRAGGHDLSDQYSNQLITVNYRWLAYQV